MSILTGNTVASTYKALLKTVDNDVVGSTLKTITDGYGNQTALLLDNNTVAISGSLIVSNGQQITGSLVVSGSQFISGSLDVSAGVKGLFFRNQTSPTFTNIITSNESIFNPTNLTIQSTDVFIIEENADYYVLGDLINSGSLIVSGTLLVDGALLTPGPVIIATTGQIL